MALPQIEDYDLRHIPDETEESFANLSVVEAVPDEIPTTWLIGGVACIAGADVNYKLEVPLDATDPVPAIIVPGYGGIEMSYAGLRHASAIRGKATATFTIPRTQSIRHALHPSHILHPEKLPSQAVWGVMRDIMQRDDMPFPIEQFDLDAHSMGGLTASEVAMRKADHVRSITFMASVGLTGHSRLSLLRKLPEFFSHDLRLALTEIQLEDNVRALMDMTNYMLRNPIRTAFEGWAVGGCDIRGSVKLLGKLGVKGVKTAALAFPEDPLFPLDKLRENIGKVVDWFVEYENSEAHHATPQLDAHGVANSLSEIHQYLAEL